MKIFTLIAQVVVSTTVKVRVLSMSFLKAHQDNCGLSLDGIRSVFFSFLLDIITVAILAIGVII
jgi:hypothetical protein